MIAHGAVWPWSRVVGAWRWAKGERGVSAANVFDEIFESLSERFGCEIAVIGRVYAGDSGELTIRPIVLWAADREAGYEFPPTMAADEGIRALVEGQIDAVVYADISRAHGDLADLFRAAGAMSLVIVPLDIGTGRGLLVAVGLGCEREALPDRVSDLLTVLVPRNSLAATGTGVASKGG